MEQSSRGRSIDSVPGEIEIDSMDPSIDSNSTVGRHTEVLHQTDSSQSVLDAPASGISERSSTVSYSDLCRIISHLHFKFLITIDAIFYDV